MSNQVDSTPSTRRGFMGAMTALTAASYNRVLGANDRVGIGFIGFGLIGKQHITNFKKSFPEVDRVALCDVYKPRLEEGLAYLENPNAKGYSDFRKMYENKDIDGVVVATPDHWHALLTIMACAAGKDVYVEKPLTVFIDEGKWMIQAMNKYKRIVVVGTQRNHNPGPSGRQEDFRKRRAGQDPDGQAGCRRAQCLSGFRQDTGNRSAVRFRLRHVARTGAQEALPGASRLVPFPLVLGLFGRPVDQPGRPQRLGVPIGHGCEGPHQGRRVRRTQSPSKTTAKRPISRSASTSFPDFMMTMGVREANAFRDSTGSVIMGSKGNLVLGSNQVVPEMHGDPVNQIPRFAGHPAGGPVYNDTKPAPWIEAQAGTRLGGGGRGAGPDAGESLEDRMFNANKRDWINCIKSRNKPFCDLDMGHRTAIICNLGNMSLRLGGRTIHWDPEKEVVVGDKEAAAMCTKQYRAPWDGILRSIIKV